MSEDAQIVTTTVSAVFASIDTVTNSYATKTVRTQWYNEMKIDTKSRFVGGQGAKSVWQENQKLQFFWIRTACLSRSGFQWDKLAAECQNPVREKSHSLSTHEWVASLSVCARVYVILCVWLLYRHCGVIFDSNDVGPSQIDRRGRRGWEQEWEMRQEENESEKAWEKKIVTQWSKSGQ